MALSLLFRILGDTSGLMRSMAGVKEKMGPAGEEAGKLFGQQFKAGIMRFVGAGAILSVVTNQIKKALDIQGKSIQMGISPEAVQELQRFTELTGLSVDQLKEVLGRVGMEKFAAVMERIQAEGGILDDQTVKELAEVGDKFKEAAAFLAVVTNRIVKAFSWLIGGGQKLAGRAIGAGVDIVGRITGNKETREIGQAIMAGTTEAVETPGGRREQTRVAASEFANAARALPAPKTAAERTDMLRQINDNITLMRRMMGVKL